MEISNMPEESINVKAVGSSRLSGEVGRGMPVSGLSKKDLSDLKGEPVIVEWDPFIEEPVLVPPEKNEPARDSDMSDDPEMSREELKARVEKAESRASEAESRVNEMTNEVSSKIDRRFDQIDMRIDRVKDGQRRQREDNRSLRGNLLTGASILAVVVVGLFTAILQRLGSVRELVIDNTRNIARAAASDSAAVYMSSPATGTGWLIPGLVVVLIGCAIVITALITRMNFSSEGQRSSEHRFPEQKFSEQRDEE